MGLYRVVNEQLGEMGVELHFGGLFLEGFECKLSTAVGNSPDGGYAVFIYAPMLLL